ncbi:anoctamin-7-like isoform X4 [Carettochelys insculpta]|uniref:anoctamin-7-like isoform X4 n=1 Tax=Carettochelys insculpta TaxID=44489 RepID=UPI003EB969FB
MIRKKGSEVVAQDTSLLIALDKSRFHLSSSSSGPVYNGAPYAGFADEEEADPTYVPGDEGSSPNTRGNYFRDGHTRIDFVLVWEEKVHPPKKRRGKLPCPEARGDHPGGRHDHWRRKFLNNLRSAGLLMEKEETLSERKTIHYVKLSAPWDVLVSYAEELCMRAPLQAQPNPDQNSSATVLRRLRIPNPMYQPVPNKPTDYYTCVFRRTKLDRFLGSDSRDSYFTHTQRHRIVYEMLARTVYGKRKRAEIGIERLLNERVYAAAFPLHEGPFEMPESEVPDEALNPRQVLYRFWAQWGCWYRYQPLDHVRQYFGEKIAIYFAWLGFYTAWLLPAAAVGTMVFFAGLLAMGTNTPAQEICQSGGQFLMCPLCDTCPTWNLSEICPMAKHLHVLLGRDLPGVLEAEERHVGAPLGLHGLPGGGGAAQARVRCHGPADGTEPHHGAEGAILPQAGPPPPHPDGLHGPCLHALRGDDLPGLRDRVPGHRHRGDVPHGQHHSHDPEMHRTQTLHEDAFTFKVFVFQFVNFYSSPFYVAFFKGRFVGYPGQYGTLLGLRNEECGPGGCLIELAQQLFIIMVGKQIASNVQEFVVPKLKAWRQQRKLARVRGTQLGQEPPRWEEDYELITCEGLFEEYLEMVLQFGFITIFVAAFPLAPLFALLNNWVEIRLDAQKFVCEYRRPVAYRTQDIGVWFLILEVLAQISVIVNAFLIAFTSDFLPRLLYRYEHDRQLQGYVNFTLAYSPPGYVATSNHTLCRYKAFRDASGNYTLFYWKLLAIRLGFIIAFEHVVFFFLRLIDWLVPDVPESLELKIKRERYLAKQALADSQEALLRQAAFHLAA